MKPLQPEAVLGLLDEGIDAILVAAESIDGRAWHRTAVGDWSGHELARHVLAVSEWYHRWLDRSEAGTTSAPFPAKQLASRNELEVSDLGDVDGPEAIERFGASARAYRNRLADADRSGRWARPFGFPYGTGTVGGHAGVAAAEWHLHAWDLSDGAWQPTNPGALYRAVGNGMVDAQPRWRQPVTRRVVNRIAGREPWLDLLKRSGRDRSAFVD